jgi:hypothetical protein
MSTAGLLRTDPVAFSYESRNLGKTLNPLSQEQPHSAVARHPTGETDADLGNSARYI